MRAYSVVAVAACGLLAACAASPERIAPSYVSTMVYQNRSCQQLAGEDGSLHAAYVTAADEQSKAHTTDKIGILLLGLPIGSMTGENVAHQVASLKGQMVAVHQTEAQKSCNNEPSLTTDEQSYVGTDNSQPLQSFDAWQKNGSGTPGPR
jgi:hypothetical protein